MSEPNWREMLPPIFAACCAKEQNRYALLAPFLRVGRVWATDGQIMVGMDPPAGLVLPLSIAGRVPPVETVLGGEWGEGVPCPAPDPGPVTEPTECGECDGSGDHDCSCGDTHECGYCDGTGTIEPAPRPVTVIEGKASLGDTYLRILFAAKATLYPPVADLQAAWKFTIDGGIEGRVMPRMDG